ncbi:5-formyltetrahydrofolate cyclo-ligase [Thalassotalea litorea]|uniref:5-formyltetrahydrofolate cyclo-ligase n=1 Tax=Thalassotalea litorea TaxID=2020715 RepID=UPI0037355CD0
MDYSGLRKALRERRRRLSKAQQFHASEQLCANLQHLCRSQHIRTLAGYLAADGEISLAPFFQWCWQNHIKTYVPVLHPFSQGHLLFLNYQASTQLQINRYSLEEPVLDVNKVLPTANIELLLAPLVGFDGNGNRLGMGGGYYDRTLSSFPELQQKTIGVAHRCQQVDKLTPQPWDIPLRHIVSV